MLVLLLVLKLFQLVNTNKQYSNTLDLHHVTQYKFHHEISYGY